MNVTRQVVLTVNTHYKSFIRSFRGDLGKGCKTLALLFDYQSKSSSNRKNDCKQELQQPEIKSVKSLTQVYNVFGSYLESELNEKYGINVVKGADDGQQLEEAIERFEKDDLPFILILKPDLMSGMTYLRSSTTKLEEQIAAHQVVDRIGLYLQIVKPEDLIAKKSK